MITSSFLLGRELGEVEKIEWIFNPPAFEVPQEDSRLKSDIILAKINEYRKREGLLPFKRDKQLDYVAYLRASHIVDTGEFSHEASNNSSYDDLVRKYGYRVSKYGENLGIGYANEEKLVNAWMLSKTHRELILGDYKLAGVHSAEEYSILIVGK